MNDKEKKAIDIIKDEIDRYKAIETPKEVYITDIKMLLNLVEEQEAKIKSLESQLDFIGEQNKYIDKLEKEKDKLEKEIDKNISKLSDSLGIKKLLEEE